MKITITALTLLMSLSLLSACNDSSSGTNNTAEDNNQASSEEPTSVYRVVPSDLSLSLQTGGENQVSEEATWNAVVELLPNDVLKTNVGEYHVFSDGAEGTLAYVGQIEAQPEKWLYAIDPADSQDTSAVEFTKTIVHEFAHILGLESQQVTPGIPKEQCGASYPVDEGCPVNGAYLTTWFDRFWAGDVYNAHKTAVDGLSGEQKEEAVASFYQSRTDSFVSEYSATDPVEDLAESFMFFVLGDLISNPTTVKEQKVSFFSEHQVFVDARNSIRGKTAVRISLN